MGEAMRVNWEKVREWVQTLGLVAIPVVVMLGGNAIAKSNADREVKAKMIEIAATVLSTPATDSMRPLRRWAVAVLRRYSEVPFSASAESTLVMKGGRLPLFGSFLLLHPDGRIEEFENPPVVTCDSAGRCSPHPVIEWKP
jgi:hypothetical protein